MIVWRPHMYLTRHHTPKRCKAAYLAVSGHVSPDLLWGAGPPPPNEPGALPLNLAHLPTGEIISPGFDDIERAQAFVSAIMPLLDWRTIAHPWTALTPHTRSLIRCTYTRITGRSWLSGQPLSYRWRRLLRLRGIGAEPRPEGVGEPHGFPNSRRYA